MERGWYLFSFLKGETPLRCSEKEEDLGCLCWQGSAGEKTETDKWGTAGFEWLLSTGAAKVPVDGQGPDNSGVVGDLEVLWQGQEGFDFCHQQLPAGINFYSRVFEATGWAGCVGWIQAAVMSVV